MKRNSKERWNREERKKKIWETLKKRERERTGYVKERKIVKASLYEKIRKKEIWERLKVERERESESGKRKKWKDTPKRYKSKRKRRRKRRNKEECATEWKNGDSECTKKIKNLVRMVKVVFLNKRERETEKWVLVSSLRKNVSAMRIWTRHTHMWSRTHAHTHPHTHTHVVAHTCFARLTCTLCTLSCLLYT